MRDGHAGQPLSLRPRRGPAHAELDAGAGVSRHAVDHGEHPGLAGVGYQDLAVAVDGHAGRRLHPAAVRIQRAHEPPVLGEHFDRAVLGVCHYDLAAAPVDGDPRRARERAASKRCDVRARHVEQYDPAGPAAVRRGHVVGHRDPAPPARVGVRRHAGGILKGRPAPAAVRGDLDRIPAFGAEDDHAGAELGIPAAGTARIGDYDLATGAGRRPARGDQALVHQGGSGGVVPAFEGQPVHLCPALGARHDDVAERIDVDPVQPALQRLAAAVGVRADLVPLDEGRAEHVHAVALPVRCQDAAVRVGGKVGPDAPPEGVERAGDQAAVGAVYRDAPGESAEYDPPVRIDVDRRAGQGLGRRDRLAHRCGTPVLPVERHARRPRVKDDHAAVLVKGHVEVGRKPLDGRPAGSVGPEHVDRAAGRVGRRRAADGVGDHYVAGGIGVDSRDQPKLRGAVLGPAKLECKRKVPVEHLDAAVSGVRHYDAAPAVRSGVVRVDELAGLLAPLA